MDIGDRMKLYEGYNDQKLLPLLPILARLDGNCFHTFTRGLERPFDKNLSALMIATADFLMKSTHAILAYVQSDEITLLWNYDELNQEPYFGGRISKLNSILASKASVFFNVNLKDYLPSKVGQQPVFDCRVWNTPNKIEAVNAFIWREMDAKRNSVSAAAQCHFSHKQLMNKRTADKKRMLEEIGMSWNDYPAFFKQGTYLRRRIVEKVIPEEILAKIPVQDRREFYLRPETVELYWELAQTKNKVEVVFEDADPILDQVAV